ncbi:MAG TPA: copper transporter [Solirubrobacteraceae bacterium]|nr:copper transporter [Solirubrobacteraceae bacterium]
MVDFRYHALSLAAVLCALAVGVLVGIAIGDSSLVSSAQDGLVHKLRGEVRETQHELKLSGQTLSEQQTLADSLWPLAVHGLLQGRSIGIVFLGEPSNEIDSLAQGAVRAAGGKVKAVLAVHEPLDASAMAKQLSGTRYAALPSDPRLLGRLAQHLGGEIVSGGRLLERVRTQLLGSYDGQVGQLEGVVVVRAQPTGMTGAQVSDSETLESGLLAGMLARGIPVVGVETSAGEPSQVPWYKSAGLSSVDDLQSVGGRTALAYALAGYRGAFGSKSSADAQLPSPASAPARTCTASRC